MNKLFWEKVLRDTKNMPFTSKAYLALLSLWAMFELEYSLNEIRFNKVADGFWKTRIKQIGTIVFNYNKIIKPKLRNKNEIIEGNNREDIIGMIKQTRDKLAHGRLIIGDRSNEGKRTEQLISSCTELLYIWLKDYYWNIGLKVEKNI